MVPPRAATFQFKIKWKAMKVTYVVLAGYCLLKVSVLLVCVRFAQILATSFVFEVIDTQEHQSA